MTEIVSNTYYADIKGYYTIGNRKTYLKSELIDWHNSKPDSWSWNFNDDYFTQFDWTKEPQQDLSELYKQRAIELREQYDYLVLYYSGGHDSTNVLYSFLDNNIRIDEVVVYYSRHDKESLQYKEQSTLTWSKVKNLKQHYPDLNIRIIDYADLFNNWFDIVNRYGFKDDALKSLGSVFSLNHMIVGELYEEIPEWKRLINKGKKFAWVVGADKPMLRFNEKQWIFNFHDIFIRTNMSPLRQFAEDGTRGIYEFFYWSPTPAGQKLLRKQCHLIKNKYNSQALTDFSRINGAKKYQPGYGWTIDTMNKDFLETIYPRIYKYGETFYTEKTQSSVYGGRDQWFYNSNTDVAKKHLDICKSLNGNSYNHFKDWYNDKENVSSGFTNAISCDYII